MAKLHSEKRIKAVDSTQAEGAAASFEAGDVIYDTNGGGGFKKKNGALGGGSWDAVGGGGGGMSSFTVTGDAGSVNQTIEDGNTLTFVGGAGLNIQSSNTDTVTAEMDYSGADSFIMAATNGTGITVDGANDKLVIYDNDDTTVKYINVSQLPAGGATNLSVGTSDATTLEIVSSTGTNVNLPLANGTIAGIMSDADKDKLDGIEANAEENVLTWAVVANLSSSYRFTGPGVVNTEDNPTLYVKRGQKYRFTKAAAPHPFRIATNAPATAAYNDGITGNDLGTGTLEWEVRMDAPAELMYYCTSHAGVMKGKIVVLDELQVLSHRQSFSADGGSPEIFDLHSRLFNSNEPRYEGGRIVIDTTNLGNNAGDKVQLDLSELYHPDHMLPVTMNFEVYAKSAAAFDIDVINPAGGPATGQQTLQSDVSSPLVLNEDATGTISVGSGQYVIIYCDGASWYYEKRSGL